MNNSTATLPDSAIMQDQSQFTCENKKRFSFRGTIFGHDYTHWLKVFHIFDWICVILIIALAGILTKTVHPYKRFLPQEDATTGYPVKDDIFPLYALMIVSLAGPPIIFIITQFFWHIKDKKVHDLHHACLGVYTAWAYTFLITTCIKLATGSYRPNYSSDRDQDSDLKQSFPSGHSSLSFSSMVFVSLYLAGKFKVFHIHSGSLVVKGFCILCPLFLAMAISISRTMDYHHQFADIIAGSLVGSGIGAFGYFLFFPWVFNKNSDLPRKHNHDEKGRPVTVDKVIGKPTQDVVAA